MKISEKEIQSGTTEDVVNLWQKRYTYNMERARSLKTKLAITIALGSTPGSEGEGSQENQTRREIGEMLEQYRMEQKLKGIELTGTEKEDESLEVIWGMEVVSMWGVGLTNRPKIIDKEVIKKWEREKARIDATIKSEVAANSSRLRLLLQEEIEEKLKDTVLAEWDEWDETGYGQLVKEERIIKVMSIAARWTAIIWKGRVRIEDGRNCTDKLGELSRNWIKCVKEVVREHTDHWYEQLTVEMKRKPGLGRQMLQALMGGGQVQEKGSEQARRYVTAGGHVRTRGATAGVTPIRTLTPHSNSHSHISPTC